MIPIQELLNRIRWDREFSKGRFEIGYYDRLEKRIIRIPFQQMCFDPNDHCAFESSDVFGEIHSIPLHRIHQVYKDGLLIWDRPL